MERVHRERQLDAESELQLEVERHFRGEGIQRSWHRQLRMVSPDLGEYRVLAPPRSVSSWPLARRHCSIAALLDDRLQDAPDLARRPDQLADPDLRARTARRLLVY